MHEKENKDGNFRLAAGIWSDNGWASHIFIVVDVGTTQNMDVPIHYQTIFRQPNENFHLLFFK